MESFFGPWSWFTSGLLIGIVLFLFHYFGKNFGVSSHLETICTLSGAGKYSSYFKKNWKTKKWGLIVTLGLIIGGFLANNYLSTDTPIKLNQNTIEDLEKIGFKNIGYSMFPEEIYGNSTVLSIKNISILLIAGICIGFGARYAGGCTSGHAINGLSNFQLPSLIAVTGFFLGGLCMVWLFFPLIFS